MRELLASQRFDTPIGALWGVASEAGVVALHAIGDQDPDAARAALAAQLGASLVDDPHPHLRQAARQLTAWATGRRQGFSVPLDLRGTPFQRRVWEVLRRIPYGQTATYAEVAARIGQPSAFRAVANACGRNPTLALVPCHRVVASGGGLGGFSAGLPLKRRMLAVERGGADALPMLAPLFAVAEAREARRTAEDARVEVMEGLPPSLRAWWLHRVEGRPLPGAAATTSEAWVAHVLEAVEVARWPELVDALLTGAERAPDATLRALADDVVEAFAARCRHEWPEPQVLERMLERLLRRAPEAIEGVALAVMARPRVPARVRTALIDGLGRLVTAARERAPHLRERAVELWTLVKAGEGDASWRATREDEPSEALMAAGLWQEAAAAAEQALAAGHGDRRALLARLADAYERLGAWDLARERLASLVAEEGAGDRWQARLRRLSDKVGGARE